MIVVDVESTGVDAKQCSLLSVGAVEFERPRNQFYMECYAFPGAHVEKEALVISGFTLAEITPAARTTFAPRNLNGQAPTLIPLEKGEREAHLRTSASGISVNPRLAKRTDREVVEQFLIWLKTCGEWTLAGQNPSFDRSFLEETAHRYHINWPLAHRTVDLHSVVYAAFLKTGKEIPLKNSHSALNLDRILKYVGLPTRAKKHNALEDAKLEAEAFARLLYRKNLLPDYSNFSLTAI